MDVWQFVEQHNKALMNICAKTYIQHKRLHRLSIPHKSEIRQAAFELMSDVVYDKVARCIDAHDAAKGELHQYVFKTVKMVLIKYLERKNAKTKRAKEFVDGRQYSFTQNRFVASVDAELSVQCLMSKLSPAERNFLMLIYYEGWSPKRAAESSGVVSANRATRRLYSLLEWFGHGIS